MPGDTLAPDSVLTAEPGALGPGLREWFDTLAKHTVKAAAFDTRLHGPTVLTGRASKGIAHALRAHGFDLAAAPESFLVTNRTSSTRARRPGLVSGEPRWPQRSGRTGPQPLAAEQRARSCLRVTCARTAVSPGTSGSCAAGSGPAGPNIPGGPVFWPLASPRAARDAGQVACRGRTDRRRCDGASYPGGRPCAYRPFRAGPAVRGTPAAGFRSGWPNGQRRRHRLRHHQLTR
jgi:hypothetical protein